MQTTAEKGDQFNFFGIFEESAKAEIKQSTATAKNVQIVLPEPKQTFTTEAQLKEMRTNPFAPMLRNLSLDQIRKLNDKVSSDLWKKRDTPSGEQRSDLWWKVFNSAVTIATEELYKQVDERFIKPEVKCFSLIYDDGREQVISYDYNPFYFDSANNQHRTSFPTHHIEFRSEEASSISGTGYRSHFFGRVPIDAVTNFADFLIKTLRLSQNIKETIIFEGIVYEFDPLEYSTAPKKKAYSKCPECQSKLSEGGDCEHCGWFPESEEIDGDEEDFEGEDFDD